MHNERVRQFRNYLFIVCLYNQLATSRKGTAYVNFRRCCPQTKLLRAACVFMNSDIVSMIGFFLNKCFFETTWLFGVYHNLGPIKWILTNADDCDIFTFTPAIKVQKTLP